MEMEEKMEMEKMGMEKKMIETEKDMEKDKK